MKKICFPFLGNKLGGSHKSAIILIRNLDRSFFKPIIVLHSNGILKKFLDKQNIKYIFLPLKNFVGKKKGYLNIFFSIIYTTLILSKFILKNKISIIHTNDVSMHLTWAIPSLVTFRKLIWHCRILYPKWRLFKVFSYFPKKIICISKFVRNSIPNFFYNKSVIIYNPVDKKKNYLKDNLKYKKHAILVGFVANFWERKRPMDFVNIAEKIISKSKKNFLFLMVGLNKDYKKESLLKEIKRRKIKKNFLLKNFVYSIEELIAKFDLLIIPAVNEPFGRTLIEAMYLKTPILANNSGGHKEIIKNNYNGWLHTLNSFNSAAELAIKIISNKKKNKQILENAFICVNKKFSLKKNVKKVSNVYNLL